MRTVQYQPFPSIDPVLLQKKEGKEGEKSKEQKEAEKEQQEEEVSATFDHTTVQ